MGEFNRKLCLFWQIPSHDESSHCLCVAGEVYCWWQTFGGPKLSDKLTSRKDEEVEDELEEEEEEEEDEDENEDDDEDSWTTEEDDYSGSRPEATAEASGQNLNVSFVCKVPTSSPNY